MHQREIPEGGCDTCPDYAGPARGPGDVIATATKAVGIRPCGGCQKRRSMLNDWWKKWGARYRAP